MSENNRQSHHARQRVEAKGIDHLPSRVSDEGMLNNFLLQLHGFLNFYQIFETLLVDLQSAVAFDSIEYINDRIDISMIMGFVSAHFCEYNIQYEGKSLGRIRITRETEITQSEQEILEVILMGLTLPLRNAIHQQADRAALRLKQLNQPASCAKSGCQDSVDVKTNGDYSFDSPFSLLTIKIDQFDEILSQYGRIACHTMIHRIAIKLKQHTRGADVAFRSNGNSFILFLPDTQQDETTVVCSRIKKLLKGTYMLLDENKINITTHISAVTVDKGDTTDSLVDRVDRALFKAHILGDKLIYVEPDSDKVLVS